jgi:hypothetical protein
MNIASREVTLVAAARPGRVQRQQSGNWLIFGKTIYDYGSFGRDSAL